jgi:predicted ATPase/class 3 adenylate cyclase
MSVDPRGRPASTASTVCGRVAGRLVRSSQVAAKSTAWPQTTDSKQRGSQVALRSGGRGHPDFLCSSNPADTDHLGAAVHADDGTQCADPNVLSGKAGSDEVEELVDVRCATGHHRNVFDQPGGVHAFIEQPTRPNVSDVSLPPAGTMTFLFTDVEGSTRLWQECPEEMSVALARHDEILRAAIDEHEGYVFSTAGDAFAAAFGRAEDAVNAALDAQLALQAEEWPGGIALRVRMGLHTGAAIERGGDYFGPELNRAARVMAAGHGGQVLATSATRALVPGGEARDLGEHHLKDLADAVHIVQLLGDGLVESFPPLRTLAATANNLPATRDEFIGRAAELAAVMDGLADHRLVTLTGAGGSGKSRLALEAGGGLLGSRRDGVWLIELAPLSDSSRVPILVASVLGVDERGEQPVQETLAEWVRGHDVLLILDNCEHLVEGVAELVDHLLGSCSDIRILATSRELLGVRGELALRVPSLSLDGEAAELLMTRAKDAVPGFDPATADLELVGQICRRLDGLPLAIELAAARLRTLSLAELAGRLDDRFRLLTGGSRTGLSRQRTLEAVVGWSYDLLVEPERELFRAVSVFPDSFTLSAAAAITGLDVLDVIDVLGRLVDKSLVLPVEAPAGGDRYQLLETLRQYGRDRLFDHGEAEVRRDELLAWALRHVELLEGDMHTPGMDAALAAVMPERTNLRAAMEWAAERDDITAALRLVTAVPMGLPSERRTLIADFLSCGADRHPSLVIARAQLTISDLAFDQGDWAAAVDAAADALARFEQADDHRGARAARLDLIVGSWGAGDLATVDGLLPELLAEVRAHDDDFGLAAALWVASHRDPDRKKAAALAAEAERRFRELASPSMVAHTVEGRALIELKAGDLDAAAPFLSEAVARFAGASNLGCTAHALEAVAVWTAARGDRRAAAELIGAAEMLREVSGAGHKPWEVRASHRDYNAGVLGDTDDTQEAIARGKLHSLVSAAALAEALLDPPPDPPPDP